jgi:hypothetical protein
MKRELSAAALASLSRRSLIYLIAVFRYEKFASKGRISGNQDLCSGQQFSSGAKTIKE